MAIIMFKKQFKDNLNGLVFSCLALTFLYCAVFIVYPTLISEIKNLVDRLITLLPKETLMILSKSDIASPAGWVASVGLRFFIISGAVYSALLGSNCLYSEKKNKTIEFLAVKPVTRSEIILNKAFADLLCIALFSLVNSSVLLAGLAANRTFSFPALLYVTLSPVLSFLVFWALFLFVSVVYKGGFKLVFGISTVFYIFVFLSKLSERIAFLKYLTPFALSDTTDILEKGSNDIRSFVAGAGLFSVFFLLSILLYNKKELI